MELMLGYIRNVSSVEDDLTGGLRMQMKDRTSEGRLSAAGLADDAEGGSLRNVESYIIHRVKLAARSVEVLL